MPDPLPLKLAKAILLPSADQDTPESGFGTTPCRDPRRSTVGLRDPVPIVFTARPADSNPLIVVKARRGPSGAGAAAAAGPPTSASASATAQRPPAYRNTRGILHYSASRGSNAWSLTSVSASSAAGSEPATTPTPAKRRASRSRSRALRRATQNSPSSVASIQPTGPAYQPRSMRSRVVIVSAARDQGSPPAAGVGCRNPPSSNGQRGSASWARTGVARCWMLATLTISGSGACSTQTACGRRARTIRSATIRCSRRSLPLRRSCSPRWSSTAGSELRPVEPARATVETLAPERRTRTYGLAPMKAASGVPQQKQKQEGNCSRIAPNNAPGSWAAPALTITSRASTTLLSPPASMRLVAAATARSKSPGGRALRISVREVGWGSSKGKGSSRKPARRALTAPNFDSGSSPGRAKTLTVRKVDPPLRQSEVSGNPSGAGASEDQVDEPPPSAREGKTPTPT